MSKPQVPVEFRYAEGGDARAVVELIQSAYRGESSRAGWTTEADLLGGQRTDAREVAAILEAGDSRLLLAVADGRVVGCVLLRREAPSVYIGMLAVSPRRQAAGIGRRLLAEAERRGQSEFGLEQARMTVIEQRVELIAWYERRGYERTGEVKPFPYGEPRFGEPKRDDLRFVVLAKRLPQSSRGAFG